MRSGGLRGFSGLVLSVALSTLLAMPLAAAALPLVDPSYMSSEALRSGAAAANAEALFGVPARELWLGPPATANAMGDPARNLPLGPPGGVAGSLTPGGAQSLIIIPDVVMAAYRNAARHAPSIAPGCRMDWAVLAGIGRVESRHGMHFGAQSVIDTQGTVTRKIIGPALNGANGVAHIPDSDAGVWDGDSTWDHAVGPMQFIPSSWRLYGRDGNGDGVRDPHNAFDAALSAAAHLCGTAAADLRNDANLDRALYGYNHSEEYVDTVRHWIDIYRSMDPSDVPRVAVAGSFPDGVPFSPFPGPHDRIAGLFDSALPLSSGALANASNPGRTIASNSGSNDGSRIGSTSGTTRNRPSKSTDGDGSSGSSAGKKPGQGGTSPSGGTTKPKPKPSPKPSPTPSPKPSPSPTPTPKPSPSPTPTPKPSPSPTPTPSPSPSPQPSPSPDPTPDPEPSEEPPDEEQSSDDGASDDPTADPVSYSGPSVSYRNSTATDWPAACRPLALWAGVAVTARADGVTIVSDVAAPVAGADDRLADTWRTRSAVWRVVRYDCARGGVVGNTGVV
jgi:hypothetical protein